MMSEYFMENKKFKLISKFDPQGDQPTAIAKLAKCKNCYPIIRDEFMSFDVSSQRKSQLRRHRDGLCTYCIERPGATKELCAEHREMQNARRRVV